VACPNCGVENEPGRKFCGECGTRLARTCASCGFANGATVRFCGECGNRLDDAAPGSSPAGSGPGAPSAQAFRPTQTAAAAAEAREILLGLGAAPFIARLDAALGATRENAGAGSRELREGSGAGEARSVAAG